MLRRIKGFAIVTIALSVLVSGCGGGAGTKNDRMAEGITGDGGNAGADQGPLTNRQGQTPFPEGSVRPLQQGGQDAERLQQPVTIPYVKEGNANYVDVLKMAEQLQYTFREWDKNSGVLNIGERDVEFHLEAGKTTAEKGGEPFTLAAPPKMINGRLMLPETAAADLFQEDMVFDIAPDGFVLFPSDTMVNDRDTDDPDGEPVDDALDFADDPNDPFAGEEWDENALSKLEMVSEPEEAIPALKNINVNKLIANSKRYLGVPYKFGARPYPQSRRFDCSSYTQYVYGKFGVDLPRTARAQARIGKTVSRKSLRKGDLLYFYVPGRFKSNKVVGHVGIYIGNRKMIHSNTEPRNGVQIRSIDRAFWKKTFITAKRVVY